MALHSIELCAGVGMLGEGARAAFEFLGHEHRTVCYVEREAAAAAQLVCLMEAGALDPAPVWSDLLTFDGAAWRGCVDFIIAGFPCQDISIAGRRAGLDGQRSGLFFNILDIADDCGAHGLFLENVSAIATATASAVDEAEGALEERAAARVVGELADRGWNAEWITIPASDVGASHERSRWFCWAWRREMDDASSPRCDGARERAAANSESGQRVLGTRYANVADAERAERRTECVGGNGCIKWNDRGRREAHRGAGVADAALGNPGLQHQHLQQRIDGAEPAAAGIGLADAPCDGWNQGRAEPGWEQGRSDAAERGGAMADACKPGLPHPEQSGEPGEPEAYGRGAAAELRAAPLFAPGPSDPIWRHFIGASRVGAWERVVTDDEAGACPWAPATKPGVRMLADGMAIVVDESRAHQLRQVGNGVVPLQAAAALVELVRRAAEAERWC